MEIDVNKYELREIARSAGVLEVDRLFDETRLVWAIQKSRQQQSCFRTDDRVTCRNTRCEWRAECLKLIAAWLR
jgi:hypothetical protein